MQHEQPGVKLQTGQQDNTGANIEIPSKEQQVEATDASIDPRNEITGLKLLILHIGLCLCNILTGLVSSPAQQRPQSHSVDDY